MEGIFLELKPLPCGATIKDMPRKILSLQQVPGHSAISKNTWITGVLFISLLSVVFVAMIMNMRQIELSAMHQEIVGSMQMHGQRLAKVSQQAIMGSEAAFTQLQDSRDQLSHHIALLKQGGIHRNIFVTAVTEDLPAIIMDRYLQKWHSEDKKINLILKNKGSLIRLGSVVNKINITNKQLINLIDQLIAHLEELGGLPNEIIAAEAMKVLVQSIEGNINTVMPGELPISEIGTQLSKDRKRFLLIINALNQGNNGLQIASLKEADALQTLHQIKKLFNSIDNNVSELQKEISVIIMTKFAAQKLYGNSEIMLSSAAMLGVAFQEQKTIIIYRLNTAIYISGAFAILAFMLFCKTFTSKIHSQNLSSEKVFNSTQKAVLRLLNEMEKLADGNLTVRITVAEDITGVIAESINHTIKELRALARGFNQATIQVAESSRQAQIVALILLTATQQQSKNIKDTAITLSGVAGSISTVSDTAAESAKAAKHMLTVTKKSKMAVQDSIAEMNAIRTYIQETSKRIKRLGKNVQTISKTFALVLDTAEQTNVIALNATLQVASASESGRESVVIAQEIKRLTKRSAEATQQIDALVKILQADTQGVIMTMEKTAFGIAEGAKGLDVAGRAFKEIEIVSSNLEQLVAAISENTDKQVRTVGRVVRNMEKIINIACKTTKCAKENTESVKQITEFCSELEASVSNFKV